MRRNIKTLFVAAAIAAAPLPAHALLISTSVGDFDVTTVTGIFDDDAAVRSLLVDQVWWGDADLADEFAGLVNVNLGLPNTNDIGPY